MEVEVLFSYEPKEQDELRLQVGDIIRKVVKQEAGWYCGTTLNGDTGVFPDNFVKILSKDGGGSTTSTSTGATPNDNNTSTSSPATPPSNYRVVLRQCRALFSYAPQHNDELALNEGDVLELLQEVEEGWWKGKLNGQIGMFPSNFVEIIEHVTPENNSEGIKNNINANMTEGESKPKPSLGQSHGVKDSDLRKERKISNSSGVGGGGAVRLRSGANGGGGSVVGITPGGAIYGGSPAANKLMGSNPNSAFQPPNKQSKVRSSSSSGVRIDKTKEMNDRINTAIEKESNKSVSSRQSNSSLSRKSSSNSNITPQPHTTTAAAEPASPPQLPPKPVRELVRALFPYPAEHADELSLKEGDVITLISKDLEDRGWWKGELNGKVGVFPDNFVQIISSDDTVKPPRPDKPPSLGSRGGSIGSNPPSTPTSASSSPTPHKGAAPANSAGVTPSSSFSSSSKGPTSPAVGGGGHPVPADKSKAPATAGAALTNGHSAADNINMNVMLNGVPENNAKLRHMNQQRPRGPNRRPPSSIFKENMRNSSGDSESSMSIDSPQNSAILSPAPNSTDPSPPPTAQRYDMPPPFNPPPESSSKILTRASAAQKPPASQEVKATLPSSVTSSNTRPASMMGGFPHHHPMHHAQAPVPWLEEFTAKRQSLTAKQFGKRSSTGEAEKTDDSAAPTSPPVSAKPNMTTVAAPRKPTSSSKPTPAPAGGAAASSSSGAASLVSTATTTSSSTTSATPFKKQVNTTAQPQLPPFPENRKMRAPLVLDEPDLVSSASSRRSSGGSGVVSSIMPAAAQPFSKPNDTTSSDAMPVIPVEKVSSSSTVKQQQIPSDVTGTNALLPSDTEIRQPPLHSRQEQPPAGASSNVPPSHNLLHHHTTTSSTSLSNKPAQTPLTTTTAAAAAPPPPVSKLSTSQSQEELPNGEHSTKDGPELSSKSLEQISSVLETLMPKMSALEQRLEDQAREHAIQIQQLTDELDEERKKRACLEIEMERLKKKISSFSTHV